MSVESRADEGEGEHSAGEEAGEQNVPSAHEYRRRAT
jgi:hypothetical protein